ncbi:MAG: hypothetical protein LBE20_06525 [Deltaproteobacteria bacterium]|jgi:dephospho-CoA kinase|nr:hypothetical protein [Deltaproteobacteria bacterium]
MGRVIILTENPGSGKSTVGNILSGWFYYKYFSAGDVLLKISHLLMRHIKNIVKD